MVPGDRGIREGNARREREKRPALPPGVRTRSHDGVERGGGFLGCVCAVTGWGIGSRSQATMANVTTTEEGLPVRARFLRPPSR